MSSIFRKRNVSIDGRKFLLEKHDISDIFKFSQPAYVIIGSTGTGTTTISLDILHHYNREAISLFFISSTNEDIRDDSMSKIPTVFRRKPEFNSLYAVWKEIKLMNNSVSIDKKEELDHILSTIIDRTESTEIITSLTQASNKLKANTFDYYMENGCNELEAQDLSKRDGLIMYIDSISKIILDKANRYNTYNLGLNELNKINGLMSEKPKIILILDDVSSAMTNMATDNRQVLYNNDSMHMKHAYKQLIIDTMTTSRHYNMICCIFLHTIELLQRDMIP
jgi:hypothetical protein